MFAGATERRLTTELSGRARRPFAKTQRATILHGPLQRVVRCHSQLVLRDVERPMENAKNLDVSVGLDEIRDAEVPVK